MERLPIDRIFALPWVFQHYGFYLQKRSRVLHLVREWFYGGSLAMGDLSDARSTVVKATNHRGDRRQLVQE